MWFFNKYITNIIFNGYSIKNNIVITNYLFYCLIWTFNTLLFYKKVLKPILNL